MIKLLNVLGISAICFSIFTSVSLFNTTSPVKSIIVKEQKMAVKENKKLEPPKETPKQLNHKLLAKYELIDALDSALTNHIMSVLKQSRYGCMGKTRLAYAQELAAALLHHTKGDLNLMLWITSMARVESSYRLNADPRVSSARGYLQVIYRYHEKELKPLGISKDDICSNPSKSVLAGVTVFQKYLKIEHGDFEKATRRYRGLSVSEKQQKSYLNAIKDEEKILKKLIEQYA